MKALYQVRKNFNQSYPRRQSRRHLAKGLQGRQHWEYQANKTQSRKVNPKFPKGHAPKKVASVYQRRPTSENNRPKGGPPYLGK